MKSLKITETDAGQFIVETSAGVRASAASLQSAFEKLDLFRHSYDDFDVLAEVFSNIRDTPGSGQITSG